MLEGGFSHYIFGNILYIYSMTNKNQHMHHINTKYAYCQTTTNCIILTRAHHMYATFWISTPFAFATPTKRRTFDVPYSASATFEYSYKVAILIFDLYDTVIITGVIPTLYYLYQYWSRSGLVITGVLACNNIVRCKYPRFMYSCIVDEQPQVDWEFQFFLVALIRLPSIFIESWAVGLP